MKQKSNTQSLGFVFGYKETTVNKDNDSKTSFSVSFKNGVSKTFPSKFQKFKDFWSQEIVVGQVSDIFIQPLEFIEHFNKEIKEFNHENNLSFNLANYEERRYCFEPFISFEQYGALQSFSMAHLYINMYQNWENNDVLSQTLEKTIGSFFLKDSRDVLTIYNQYKEVSAYIYEKETASALGEHVPFNTNKPKI